MFESVVAKVEVVHVQLVFPVGPLAVVGWVNHSHPHVLQTLKALNLKQLVVDGLKWLKLSIEIMSVAFVVILREIFTVGCLSILVLLDLVAVLLLTNHHRILGFFF